MHGDARAGAEQSARPWRGSRRHRWPDCGLPRSQARGGVPAPLVASGPFRLHGRVWRDDCGWLEPRAASLWPLWREARSHLAGYAGLTLRPGPGAPLTRILPRSLAATLPDPRLRAGGLPRG